MEDMVMKKMLNWILTILFITTAFGTLPVWAAGQKADAGSAAGKPMTTVKVAVHANGGGSSLAAVASELGYFAEYGINPQVTVVESGPAEMAAMRADNPTLDIGFIGPGVAWNPLDPNGNSLTFVFFDSMGTSERLMAQKGVFRDVNGNGKYDPDEIFTGLKGKTVYFEVGTTSGGWFKNIIAVINSDKNPADQLWIACEDAAYLAGYTAPNSNPENRVLVVNFNNANIPAAMHTTGSDRIEIAVPFTPIPSIIQKQSTTVESIVDSSLLPPEKNLPDTFVANTKWLRDNPELAQNFITVLYKASIWRAENIDEAMRMAERLCQRPVDTFVSDDHKYPTKAQYKEWFSDPNSTGYNYMRALYNERVPNLPQGAIPKPFEQAFDFSYMLKAIGTVE
jgi:ABC-type nitrate/sulfonate/bicarbonate transport system substrate-binding protein